MTDRFFLTIAASACILFGAAVTQPAFAAGDGGGSSNTAAPKCPQGKVWDPQAKNAFGIQTGKCVDASELGNKPASDQQGMIYNYGRDMAQAGNFEEAIDALKMAPDQSDPRVLNYLGYSNRKLGRMDTALAYYRASVAADPDFSLVREYLGEAYIQLGMLEQAREQLSEIERICGSKACDEYGQLAELIVDSQVRQ